MAYFIRSLFLFSWSSISVVESLFLSPVQLTQTRNTENERFDQKQNKRTKSEIIMLQTAVFILSVCSRRSNGAEIDQREFRKAMLGIHHELRSKTATGKTPNQPKATNMNKLQWDTGLAKLAQKMSDICIFKQSDRKLRVEELEWFKNETSFKFDHTTKAHFSVGENLFASTALTVEEMVSGVQDWYDEHKDYTFVEGAAGTSAGVTHHYTQVVWAKTRYVGCAYTKCNYLSVEDMQDGVLLACHYYPSGNWPTNHAPYQSGGEPCTQCEEDRGDSCGDGMCNGCKADDYNYCTMDGWGNCDVQSTSFCSVPGQKNACRKACNYCGAPVKTATASCIDEDFEDGVPRFGVMLPAFWVFIFALNI